MKRQTSHSRRSQPLGEVSQETRGTILLVDDDPTTCQVVTVLLESEGYVVHRASNGVECIQMVGQRHPDLILLDIILPVKDGREVCRELRQTTTTPIIMLSALTSGQEKTNRLNDGADDYISKPYNNDELLARISAVLRRTNPNYTGRRYRDDKVCVDFDAHTLQVNSEPVTLSPKEWRLLEYLHRHQGRTVDRQTLLRYVWGKEYAESYQYLKVFVSSLRHKLGDHARRPRYIHTEHEAGYRFEGLR